MKTSKAKKHKVPYEHRKTAYWVISDICNYRCEYCFTLSKQASPIDPMFIAEALRYKLTGNWEIILSGGEPFAQRKLFSIAKKLKNAGHSISIYTNFSARDEAVLRFLEITGDSLAKFFASLHLKYAKGDDFLKKILRIEKKHPGLKEHLFVHTVANTKSLNDLEKIKRNFFNAGVQLIVFPWLSERLKFNVYTEKQSETLNRINDNYNLENFKDFSIACGNYGLDPKMVNFKGKKCPAGHESIFVVPTGEVYSCMKSNRTKLGLLGNIFSEDFQLRETSNACPFGICTYPASYRQYFWCLPGNASRRSSVGWSDEKGESL